MPSSLASTLANLSLMFKQPLPAVSDFEAPHDDALITKRGDYLAWVRVDGLPRMAERQDLAAIAEAMRLDLSGALETEIKQPGAQHGEAP